MRINIGGTIGATTETTPYVKDLGLPDRKNPSPFSVFQGYLTPKIDKDLQAEEQDASKVRKLNFNDFHPRNMSLVQPKSQ